ncbi:VanZ family protein [uncultured Cellulomonas sp.]|uniref:VanZ family protein n=1 Tax=uncultured Cellulomonas sp. TaxID=189682 RepID=UPI0028E2BD7F|nr:VanZ family protein [uncultured Cellulomonas sp.]
MVRDDRVTRVLLVVYLIGLVRVTLWPRIGADDTFDLVRTVLAWLNSTGVPLSFSVTEFLANIALFVPFGILVGLLTRSPWWAVVGLGLATSAVIELVQLLFLPDRVADLRDLLANTLGTAVGVGVLLAYRRRARRPSPVRVPA